MRRIISVILSLIAAVTFTFSTFSFAYAGGDKPKATYITGTSSVDGGFKVKYKTYDSVDGYQIRYSTKHDFENDKRVKVKDNSKGSKTVKGLKAKTTYFVKVRTYKYDGDKIIYSSWCDSEPISVEKATSKKKSTKKKESNSSSKKMWLSKTSVTLQAGSGVDLVLHNAKNVVKWSSSNNKVAWADRATSSSKNLGTIQAVSKGTAVITAKVDGKTFKCHVKVIADDYHASEATEAKIKQALKIVNNSMSTQEKVLKLTIWTCDHLKRVYGEYWSYEPENTVNCILKGKATRYGYNDFLDELLSSAGIKTMYVNESYGGARLKVSIDGKWYNLDVYRMDPSTQDSSGHGLWSYSMPFFLFSDAEAYKYHSQYYSKPSKEFEKYNPPATSTRFDFLSMIISKGKEDNPVDFEVNPEYFMQAYTEDCAGNQYNPWVTGTWRNY